MQHADKRSYTDWEAEAVEHGGQVAGRYLEKIGKSDLASLTKAEWLEFLATFDAARSAHLRDRIPF